MNTHMASLLHACMGAGKSKMAIEHCRKVSTIGNKRTLILCPASVVGVWRGQFHTHGQEEFDVVVLDGRENSAKKAERLHKALFVQTGTQRPIVVVMNYELFWRTEILKIVMSVTWEKMICDEIHRIKSHSSTCSKEAWHVGGRAGSRTGLTGTPMPNNPGEIFAQYRFLDVRIFGKFWTHFRNRYAIMNQYIPQKVDKWINLEELHKKVDQIRYYIGPEVLVLPDKQDIVVEVDMSPKGRKAYDQMKKESIVELRKTMEDGSQSDPKAAFASNGAVQFLRLLQLAQGYITDEDGEETDTDTEKRKSLLDLLESAGEPVCVYAWFRHDLAVIKKCCDLLNLRYGEISGARKDLTEHGKMPESIDVMGVQCKSGSSGIDLTRARIGIVMNSGLLSPGDYDQMMARQYRPGQTRDVIYYHLVSKRTVEEKLIKARQEKREIVEALLSELFEEEEFF